jgi:hypothetical protein
MSTLEDRRKEARELVVEFTLVYDSAQGSLLGYLRDLTAQGAQVSGNKKLSVGSPVSLSIELPRDLPGVIESNLLLDAKVVRCIEVTERPPSYAVGFEFLNLQPMQIEVIEKLLQRYYFRRPWAHE